MYGTHFHYSKLFVTVNIKRKYRAVFLGTGNTFFFERRYRGLVYLTIILFRFALFLPYFIMILANKIHVLFILT